MSFQDKQINNIEPKPKKQTACRSFIDNNFEIVQKSHE